jgi:4-amino-4-deoxy-L-arabinose transferase-like glycosyltransferase
MLENGAAAESPASEKQSMVLGEGGWSILLCLVCLIILFHGLRNTALFEPDEGRNAEKAREILLLGDWVTPHQNFLPTLDKPIFFYWLVALAFKIFGFAEWSARLPSSLSAVGCLLLVYCFARTQWGAREALWSCLALVTSIEFVILSRIVILDMTLTLFITWALMSFYAAQQSIRSKSRRNVYWLSMYAAMGAATLTKGLLGVIVPGLVIFFYVVLSRKWFLLRQMRIIPGAVVYLVIVAPWYLWAEMRNPGYLRYFLWEEHFVRFLTPYFGRTKGWYYFFIVVGIGFLPWSVILPVTVRSLWKRWAHDVNHFLALWVVVPLVFFSLSHSQLPHYILPIFPALALLTGRALGIEDEDSTDKLRWRFFILSAFPVAFVVYLLIGAGWPHGLPVEIRPAVIQKVAVIGLYAAVLFLLFAVLTFGHMKLLWKERGVPLLCTSVSLALFWVLLTQIIAATSFHRVSKSLAREIASVIDPQDRIVFYDTYIEGIPFYLRIHKPIWLVQSPEKQAVMGSYYVRERRPVAAAGYGRVFFTFKEFAEQWKNNDVPLRVLVKEKNLTRLSADIGVTPKSIVKMDKYVLASNR